MRYDKLPDEIILAVHEGIQRALPHGQKLSAGGFLFHRTEGRPQIIPAQQRPLDAPR